ncbi:serine hydrolase domain-containing protein [Bernardetia sp. OM2101]|uniref:serine hydrolase domain-containing protein n=1 Tax=Bernardetia sp. OM2101 TaxID=3344876 RepID=UPI0035CE9036
MKKYICVCCILFLFVSCLADEPFKLNYTGFEPIQNYDDWIISTPQEEEINTELLNKAYQLVYEDERFKMAKSLLVFRNGKLVAEAYPNDKNDINKLANIQSCTKSVTSILTGIAIQDSLIDSIDEKLYAIYPTYFDEDTDKRDITISDALTMRTGLEFDNSKHTLDLYRTSKNSIKHVLSFKKEYPAGLVMNYNDGAPQLISKVIETKSNKNLEQYAAEKLFSKLNITKWKWEKAKDGTTFGAFSLFLKPRDLGKLGQLLLQNGKWNTKQLIDSTYLKNATTTQVSANSHNEPYGYYFWILPAWNAYYADGHGGQFVLVVPNKNLVIVYTAWGYTNQIFWDKSNELMTLLISSCN